MQLMKESPKPEGLPCLPRLVAAAAVAVVALLLTWLVIS